MRGRTERERESERERADRERKGIVTVSISRYTNTQIKIGDERGGEIKTD